MPTVLAEKRMRSIGSRVEEPLNDTRSDIVSPGGGLILAVTILLTMFLIMSLLAPVLDGLQTVILAMLTLVCWGYLLNCTTERLRLEDGYFEFKAALGRTYKFPLETIRGFRLTDLGVSLNGSMYVLEMNLEERSRPLQISLGPCWQKNNLVRFLKSLGQAMERR